MKKFIGTSLIVLAMTACTTIDPYTGESKTSKATKGAVIGAAAGAVLGAATNKDEAFENAVYGAVAGAAVGGAIGYYMDKQEAELRKELAASGVQIVRNGNDIDLIMPSNITFDSDQSAVKYNFYDTLNSVSKVLAKYDETNVLVTGHTDSTGSEQYNMDLSIKRAESVGNYLASHGVYAQRVQALGFGESQPIADNTTESGKAENRRVEITLRHVNS
ncbi:MAG: OmpA family protein [bacterium]